jgi:hypothetical protein
VNFRANLRDAWQGADKQELTDQDQILDFVQRCRDEHIAPYPASLRVISEATGLSVYRVRVVVDELLSDGSLTKLARYPDHGVVLA